MWPNVVREREREREGAAGNNNKHKHSQCQTQLMRNANGDDVFVVRRAISGRQMPTGEAENAIL